MKDKTNDTARTLMVLILIVLAMWISCGSANAQGYISLAVGTTTQHQKDNAVLTYQGDLMVLFDKFGGRAAFSQTDGINHTFDSYTFSGVYQPLRNLAFLAGYRHDNGRGWSKDVDGFNFGAIVTIPIQKGVKIKIEGSHTFNEKQITNIMFGLQLRFIGSNNKSKRFF